MESLKTDKVDLLLSSLSKEQLGEFIKKECTCDGQFQDRFLALGAGIIFKPDPASYTLRVEELIEDYGGRHRYVEYRDTPEFSCAVCRILDEADAAMRNHQWEVAVAVLTGIVVAGEEILNCGDDSSGDLGGIVDLCFRMWHQLCAEEALPEKIKSEIFELSITSFSEGKFKGWNYWWDWMKMAVSLSDTSEKQKCVLNALDKVINTKGDEWSVGYHIQTAQKYKLEILSNSCTPEEQHKFMYDNVGNPDFRRKLLQEAWNEGNYDEVLRLAKDGVSHDAEWVGLVDDWHRWEFKVYRRNNNKPNILRLAKYFFFAANGWEEKEYSMISVYSLMKSVVPAEKWNSYVEALISKASEKKDGMRVLFIYTQEKMWGRYMEYLRKNPSLYWLDEAPKEVRKLYSDEFIRLYSSGVKQFFQGASDRNSYREGVVLLRKLIKYGGKEEVDKIVAEQKIRTPRRPALLDELSKL